MSLIDRLNDNLDFLLLTLFATLAVGLTIGLVNPQAVARERHGTVEIYELGAVDSTSAGV
jgi:hypothetical protein